MPDSSQAPLRSSHARYNTDALTIEIPHGPSDGPLTAIKSVLLQSSLAELKAHGFYDRYTSIIAPHVLKELELASLAPGWIPIELAHQHYDACERMRLGPADFERLGLGVGNRVQTALLVSLAKKVREANFDLWQAAQPLHRMWPRIFQGGSTQVWRVGPKEKMLEERGYSLNMYEYFRRGHIAVLTATYAALGCNSTVRLVRYDAQRDELFVSVAWA